MELRNGGAATSTRPDNEAVDDNGRSVCWDVIGYYI